MKIFKVSAKNKGLKSPPLYFKEERTAEAIISAFNHILAEGKTIEWECEIIEVLSHEESFNQFINILQK